jgi:NAD(P)-dependent dehydrogenase (short-subunit alcohol dehydrogenase family)
MSKVWLITGSSRGLGRAVAEAALEKGDRVIATARKPGLLGGLKSRHGERLRQVALDVTDAAQAGAAMNSACVQHGGGR